MAMSSHNFLSKLKIGLIGDFAASEEREIFIFQGSFSFNCSAASQYKYKV
jgi:hypothetical protein